jgi:hypothetical protein
MVWGGKIKDHAHAQVDAWDKIINHFRKHLPQDTAKSKL